jgi:diaminohydroxyphosphoribosylaminopyrimidine deaminase / 5-amino-6-(5-phosphoribosylamino)uracil reductase
MPSTVPTGDRPRELDAWHMRRALELAAQGRGFVEPNPLVGCVIARGAEIIGEGWHGRFGGPHAEVVALSVAGSRAAGSAMYVTLEPCCHFGKTPPCTKAILAAGIREVVIAEQDPFPQVSGHGIAALRAAGLQVDVGVLSEEAQKLNAPYRKLITHGRPWVIAKWAMTLDGRIATVTGSSRWISNEQSRAIAHHLRGQVDAVVVGRVTAFADDPLLTARPAGARVATRIVVDSQAVLSTDSQLVRTAADAPLLVAAAESAFPENVDRLRAAGCEVLICPGGTHRQRLDALLAELGRRRMTNVLVEGGSRLLGSLFDARAVDEVHAFIAPRMFGGEGAPVPIAGAGLHDPMKAFRLDSPRIELVAGDIYIHGHLDRRHDPAAS